MCDSLSQAKEILTQERQNYIQGNFSNLRIVFEKHETIETGPADVPSPAETSKPTSHPACQSEPSNAETFDKTHVVFAEV